MARMTTTMMMTTVLPEPPGGASVTTSLGFFWAVHILQCTATFSVLRQLWFPMPELRQSFNTVSSSSGQTKSSMRISAVF